MNEIAKLIIDNYNGDLPAKFEATTQADRDNMLRQEMLEVLGMKKYDAVSFRKAMRNPAKAIAIYEIIENVITEGLIKGTYKTLSSMSSLKQKLSMQETSMNSTLNLAMS